DAGDRGPASGRAGRAVALLPGPSGRGGSPGARTTRSCRRFRRRHDRPAGRGYPWCGWRDRRTAVPDLPGPVRDHFNPAPRGHHRRGGAGQAEGVMLLGPALGLSAILFSLGVAGVLLRRNAIVLFMCVELMLNAVNLAFVALAQLHGAGGYIMVLFVMTVAAAEAAVGLAIILAIFRHKQTVDLQNFNLLRG